MTSPQRIVMVSTAYRTGGAEHSAADLMEELRHRNIECRMFVGSGADARLGLYSIPSGSHRVAAFLSQVGRLVESLDVGPLSNRFSQKLARKARNFSKRFEYPLFAPKSVDYVGPIGSFRLLDSSEPLPDLVHAHNLHGGSPRTYFDLRALPALSARVPFVLSLRDCWTMSGHCAHSFECDRWQIGCGQCPDLGIYPPILTDRTAENWREKRGIYRASKLYVHAISDWVKQRAEKSILADGIRDLRVIHTGIDRSIFSPGEQAPARRRLNLPIGHHILAFVATRPTENCFKDFACLRSCLGRLGTDEKLGPILLVAIGGSAGYERIGSAELVLWSYSADRNRLADLYRSADIYLHAAKADTFPRAVLEALACGTPVIANAVGGIPEQIRSLDVSFRDSVGSHSEETATGILVKARDDAAMAAAVKSLLSNKGLLRMLGAHAAKDAAIRFDLQRQTDKMIDWYKEIIDDFKARHTGTKRHAKPVERDRRVAADAQ
jgi:glycosyltransferase involved in cell wall biosynthesis